MLTLGILKIGTLFEYRDEEKYGDKIGDAKEGKKSLVMDVENASWNEKNQPDFTKGIMKFGKEASVNFVNFRFAKEEESPNHYLYCTSEVFDQALFPEFKSDTCVVIHNTIGFFSAVNSRMKATFEGLFPCQYTSREVAYDKDHGIHPALIKDPKYRNQKEVRALWQPQFQIEKIKPIIIYCPEIIEYCEIHHAL